MPPPDSFGCNTERDEQMERFYETTKLLEQFGLQRGPVLLPLATYIRDMARTQLLSVDAMKEMGTRLRSEQEGAEEIRDHLIRANLRLVINIARRFYANSGIALEDRIQDGNIGLIRAVDRYEPEKGAFSTYATFFIKSLIGRGASEYEGSLIRIPRGRLQEYRSACRKFLKESGRYPKDEELKERGFTAENLQNVRKSLSIMQSSQVSGEDDRDAFDGTFRDDWLPQNPGVYLEDEEEAKRVHRALERLNPRERRIICERFGLNFGVDRGTYKTLEQIGDAMGVSRARIGQLELPAKQKLQIILGLDLAISDPLRPKQTDIEHAIRMKAIEVSKELDIVPGFVIRKLLANDGRRHSWDDIAEYLEIPVEEIQKMARVALDELRERMLGNPPQECSMILEQEEEIAMSEVIVKDEIEDDRKMEEVQVQKTVKHRPEKKRTKVEEIMESLNGTTPEIRIQLKRAVIRLLPFMPPFRYSVVTKRWGLNGEMVHSIEEIAKSLGRNKSVIESQLTSACNDLQGQFETESWWKSIS